ncbi:hypothetical protein SynMITS9220_01530 [Synechococcus sp. MIT S9220]|nr:hypothetical protein SynMITS9220_01530 [Synechococcus sp. MIT S9220]
MPSLLPFASNQCAENQAGTRQHGDRCLNGTGATNSSHR